jgi:hypothetical protein
MLMKIFGVPLAEVARLARLDTRQEKPQAQTLQLIYPKRQ